MRNRIFHVYVRRAMHATSDGHTIIIIFNNIYNSRTVYVGLTQACPNDRLIEYFDDLILD